MQQSKNFTSSNYIFFDDIIAGRISCAWTEYAKGKKLLLFYADWTSTTATIMILEQVSLQKVAEKIRIELNIHV